MDNYIFYLTASVWILMSSEPGSFLWWFNNRVRQLALKDEDSCGGASISGAPNGGATYFFLLVQRFEANLW
jgi:hypothetical protein